MFGRYRGRRRIADADMHFEPAAVRIEVTPDVSAYAAVIDAEMDRVLGPKMAAVVRSSPTSAEALREVRPAPDYGLWQITPPDFGDLLKRPIVWRDPKPISWRETIASWQEAYRSFARRLTPPAPVGPDPGTAEWWEWHYGSVLFDEHLGMLELPPGKGLARKGTP